MVLPRKVQRLLDEGRLAAAIDLIRQGDDLREGAHLLVEQGYVDEAMAILAEGREFRDAGRLALVRRNYPLAARYFEESGDLAAAALAHERGGALGAALMLHMQLEDVARVAALAMREWENPRVLELAATFLRKKGERKLAVALLVKGRRPGDAARILEQDGDQEGAIKLYEEAGDALGAARLYESRKEFRRAAYILMKAGQFCEAAETLVRGGEALQAAKLYRRLGKLTEALAVLDRIHPSSPIHADAMLLASTILEQQEDLPAAAQRLAQLLDRIGYSRQNEETIYRLVDLQLDTGDLDGAELTLERARDEGGDVQTITEQISVVREISAEPPETSPLDDATSTTLGFPNTSRYKLVQRLARGGHGELFLVRDTQLGREVVFKLLHSESLPSKVAQQYFKREARAAARLSHPNIVRVFDVGEIRGRPFYTMEYIKGINLLQLVDGSARGPLSMEENLLVCRQICEALAHAHDNRVVHRDVKLDNVMLTQSLQVKLLDFGLAKALDENPHASQFIVGTPSYMSPEQLAGGIVDERTDIYSLGVLMYRLFTGVKPFDPNPAVARRSREGPPPDPRIHDKRMPRQLAEAIIRCLEPNPDNRFRSARSLAVALSAVPV